MGIAFGLTGRDIYLDTNIFIYAFEAYPQYIKTVKALFNAIDREDYRAFTSELTLAELLVKPLTDNNQGLVDIYLNHLQSSSHLTILPVSKNILIAAATLRAKYGSSVKLPDAIHFASALTQRCTTFISNDKRMKSLSDLTIITLDDLQKTTPDIEE